MAGAEGRADDTGCVILHVDMDAFFASVEVRRRPELRGRPVVVGGLGPRGVVSSASYEARASGVGSAMPMARARRLCPEAAFIQPDQDAYHSASQAIMATFHDITPLVMPLSVDEAFLDVSGAGRIFGSPSEIARLIRGRIWKEQELTCSVGVASTLFIAKLGSTRAKPDGLVVIPSGHVLDYLHPLPISALWGVGAKTEETLLRLGLTTVGQVAQMPVATLRAALGPALANQLHELSWGRDRRRVTPERAERSVGAETTFDHDVTDPDIIRRTLLALSETIASRARSAARSGRTVTVRVRYADFRTVSRSRTLPVATDIAHEMFTISTALVESVWRGDAIRLVGIRLEGLTSADAARQLSLGGQEDNWREAERAKDAIVARYGRGLIGPATLLGHWPNRASTPEHHQGGHQ